MNKKGQELSLQTIIIAVIVVLVLIVIVTFFLGGFSRVTKTITGVFFPITAGTDLTIAVQTCEQRCDQARLLPDSVKKNSAFCTNFFNIDKNGDGEADTTLDGNKLKEFYCYDKGTDTGDLGVNCLVKYKDGEAKLVDICIGRV
ncbi:hypothetical protein HYX16_04540 [Candidatus Woesearchaeota archaeon]|nr:hypothetical protein [Candidatus Woesearchaeota archaeon]